MSRIIVNRTKIPIPPWMEESSYMDSLEDIFRDTVIKRFGQIPDDMELGFLLDEHLSIYKANRFLLLNPCTTTSRGKLPGRQFKKKFNLNLARKEVAELVKEVFG